MKTRRQRRQLPRIDLTPFVSIALLLITFFIWIKQIQRPVVLNGYTHTQCKCDYEHHLGATLFLLDYNLIGLLRYGPAQDNADYLETDYSAGGLRTQLATITQADSAKRAVVVIVPTPQSTIKNLVDVIDELAINGRIGYTLAYTPSGRDYEMMATYQHYKSIKPQQPVSINLPPYHRYF